MTPNFYLFNNTIHHALTYSILKFHSGEIQVKLCHVNTTPSDRAYELNISSSVLNSDHIMELLQLVEALRHYFPKANLILRMPYCAYSRQDRRCNAGESFSLKVFANLINSCNFLTVYTENNHSDVATALINNCVNNPTSIPICTKVDFLVSPDAGANKKVSALSQAMKIPFIRADKQRDLATGAITETIVYIDADSIKNKTLLIVDDICQGGRTFLELAKAIKAIQPDCTVNLHVTHMMNSEEKANAIFKDSNVNSISANYYHA